MKKILSIGIIWLGAILHMCGQTYYYELTKKVYNNQTITNVSGGQFITFMADICYESTSNGLGIGHGNLFRKTQNAQYKEYRGDSYWGTATFKFKSDLSKLNVITDNGEIWVYTRTTAPASAKTCSLIRKGGQNNHSNNSDSYNPNNTTINNNTIINHNYGNGISSGSNHNSSNQHSTGTWVTKTCTACNGTGKSIAKNYAPNYGGTQTKSYCNICNGYEYPHSHKTCGICKGKGYVKEYKY